MVVGAEILTWHFAVRPMNVNITYSHGHKKQDVNASSKASIFNTQSYSQ